MAITDATLKELAAQAADSLFVAENNTADINSADIKQVIEHINTFLDDSLDTLLFEIQAKVSKAANAEYIWKILQMTVEAKANGTIV